MKSKNLLGLFAILPLMAVALLTVTFEEAEARNKEIGNVKLPEPEPDVNLVLKQSFGPVLSQVEPFKTTKGFTAKSDNGETYKVVYLVHNSGTSKVWNVDILVESDNDSQVATLQGKLDPKHSTIVVSIEASNPESIEAKIIGYQT